MNPARVINDAGRAIVMRFTPCRLKAHRNAAGQWAIGFGHSGDVREGQIVSRHQAEAILDVDLMRFEVLVDELAPKSNANEFSALVSYAFSVGAAEFERSNVLARFKDGYPALAAAMFITSPGAQRRRSAEARLFSTPVS